MNDEITEPTVHLCWNEHAIRRAAEVLRAAHLDIMAADVEAHLKPSIEEPAEPTEYGSVILARADEREERVRWSKPTAEPGWFSEHGAFVGGYQMLSDVEVLRIGVGEATYPHPDGDVVILGPETFKASDSSVICHQGENYYPAETAPLSQRIELALIDHQRKDPGSCLCGWSELGASHARHVAGIVLEIVS